MSILLHSGMNSRCRVNGFPHLLAGNWRTSRMVAHYSATAERGAVAKYL